MIAAVLTSVVTYGELCIAAGTYVNGSAADRTGCGGRDFSFWDGFTCKGSLSEPVSAPEYAGHLRGDLSWRVDRENQSPPGRYHLCRSVGIGLGRERLKKIILEADAVILSDISDEVRNALIKFCYRRGIRVYVTPKISDLILRGAEDVQLFYTPLLLSRNRA